MEIKLFKRRAMPVSVLSSRKENKVADYTEMLKTNKEVDRRVLKNSKGVD